MKRAIRKFHALQIGGGKMHEADTQEDAIAAAHADTEYRGGKITVYRWENSRLYWDCAVEADGSYV